MTTVISLWACRFCCWVWPEDRMFCGVCGRNRAEVTACHGALRMVVGVR